MSWLKRTIKKVGRAAGNVAKMTINTVGAPVSAITGKPVINPKHFKGQKWLKAGAKHGKAMKTVGKVALAAGAVAGGAALLGGGSVVAGLAKLGKFRPKSKISNQLTGAKPSTGIKTVSSALNGTKEGGKILNAFIPKDSKVGKILEKLPSLNDILGGAADGAGEVLQDSELGQEVEKQAEQNWIEKNQPKIMGGVIALLSLGLGFMIFKKK